jgi:alginate O-acetyltransferase complex protein AlgI
LRAKRAVLFTSNVAFAGFLASSPGAMLPTTLFVLGGFALVRLAQAQRRPSVTAGAAAVAVAAFVCLKRYTLPFSLPSPSGAYSVVGLSYVLFRVVHLIVDAANGAIPVRLSFTAFFNYCCSFLCWVSGPIQRYEEHCEQERRLAEVQLSAVETTAALSRIVTGVFKIAVVSAVLWDWHGWLAAVALDGAAPVHFVVTLATTAAVYTLYMYYNFAGYMDVVIGVGACYGFCLPENFDRPFAARNFLEFWTRWHVTLSNWFKVYVFNPLLRALAARWPAGRSITYLGVVAYFVTFALMGIWHGSTPVFALYGLLLGGGVSANKLYEIEAGAWLGKARFRRLRAHWLYAGLCRGAVFAYFSAALLCFWAPARLGRQLLAHPALGLATFFGLTIAAALVLDAGAAAGAAWRRTARRFGTPANGVLAQRALLGMKTYIVALLILTMTATVPSFVYAPF